MKKTAIWNWIFAALLALGTATFAAADDHGSDSGKHGSDNSGSTATTTTGNGAGAGQAQPGDDHGNQPEAGDDKGGHDNNGNPQGPGDDQNGNQDFRLRRKLAPTAAGMTLDASGHFVIRVQGTRQRLQVEAEAMVPDGTIFMVFADSNLAGTLKIQMGEGELELDSDDGDLPEGLDPVKSIRTLTVVDSNGNVILQGQV